MNKIIMTVVLFISSSISGCFANIADLDDDGIRDELDDDIDGDGWSNIEEKECGTNSTLFSSFPAEPMECNKAYLRAINTYLP